jgi:hypothetical protein
VKARCPYCRRTDVKVRRLTGRLKRHDPRVPGERFFWCEGGGRTLDGAS